ncbi:hypothetical protein PAMP_021126 [Pampus punctatissimus]
MNGFGKFQIKLVLIQILSRITIPLHFLLNNFIGAVPSHHCNISGLDDGGVFGNLTLEQKLAVGIPAEQDGPLSSCLMFSVPQYKYLSASNSSEDKTIVPCQNGWVYDNSTFKSTLATEWDLVCSRKAMNKATVTIFFIGVMCGAPLFGFLSDRFGRRPLLLVSYLASMTFASFSAFSTSIVMFAVMRFFTGMSLSGISIISVVLNVEWFGIEHRTFSGIIISLDWSLGSLILIGFVYWVKEWRMLILAVTSPLILAVIAWRWLPESARWLMANGKVDAAHNYIMKCAEMNNRKKQLATVTPERVGRKRCESGTLLLTGLCLFINMFVAKDKVVIRTVVGVLGKAFSEAAFTIMFLFTTELYPTVIRQNGLGYTSFLARLGVSISPLIMLLEDVWHPLPALTYCAVAVGSGLMVLLLPETLNAQLPELIEDIEKPLKHWKIKCVEWVDIKHRKLIGVIDSLSWTVGYTGFAAIAYFVTDWRRLIVSVTSPVVLAIITWRWMPESARWLIANGKLEQAQKYLKKCAKMNQTEELNDTLKPEILSTIVVTDKRDRVYSYIDLIRSPKMRKLTLSTGTVWLCVACTYYGISFNIKGFGLNIHLTQFIYAVIEFPFKIMGYYILDKIGRRCTLVGSLLMVGVCFGINIVVPKDMSVVRTVASIIGKGFSSASFSTVVLYSSELYPTVVRQNGMGYNSFMGRFGVAVAPLILLLDEVWTGLSQIVLCCLAVLGGIVARTLSETCNRCLPETIEDIEEQW